MNSNGNSLFRILLSTKIVKPRPTIVPDNVTFSVLVVADTVVSFVYDMTDVVILNTFLNRKNILNNNLI